MSAATTEAPELLDTPAAAAFCGMAKSTFDTWRSEKVGPPFLRIGRRVKYRAEDLLQWLDSRLVANEEPESAD